MNLTKFIPMARRGRNFLAITLIGACIVQPIFAQDTAKTSIQQNAADEQDVRQHTAVLVAQVQALIDELTANGISGEDVKVLQTTKAVLNNLSSQEMERVIASLQKAGNAAGTESGRQSVLDAYAGQKGIILEFHQILKDYEQRQAALELPARFKELTNRQTETMWTTVQVAVAVAGKSTTEMTSMQQTTVQIAQSDQNALTSDVARAQQQLETAAQGSTGDEGNAMQQAEKDLKTGVLQKALEAAASDLEAGHLLQATSEQKIARDQLRLVTKDLNPATDAVAALNETSAELAKLIQEQKDLLDETNAGIAAKPRPTGLDLKQGVLVDKTDSLQEDMQALSAASAAIVKDAINPMQLSRVALAPRGTFVKAPENEQDAIAKLEEAQKQLQQQLADAQKAAEDASKDSVAKLQDLQKQIQSAMQQQQIANQTTQNSNSLTQAQQQQSQVQQQTSALQQTAQPLSLPASQALANAANQMAQAQQAMTNSSTAAAQAAQQAAQAALAQANQAVSQQIASAQAAAANPAALAAAANSLQTAQSNVSQAIAAATPPSNTPSPNAASATPPSASSPPATNPPATPAASAPSMQAAAAALAQAAQATAAAAATPGLPSSAASAVQSAQASIAQGQQAAAQGNASATAAAAQAAQASLAQAQAALAMAQAGIPGSQMAGGPPATPGPPTPGMPGMTPTPPGPDMPSMDGAKTVSGGSTDKGTLHDVKGYGSFLTVASRNRAAIDQTQAEKRPQEYAPMIDQYMKNLADQSSDASP